MKGSGGFWLFVAGFLAIWYFLFRKPSSINTCSGCTSNAPGYPAGQAPLNLLSQQPAKSTSQLGSPSQMFDNSGNLVCPTGWHADIDPFTGDLVCVQDSAPVLTKVQQQTDPCSSPMTWSAARCVTGATAQGATLN